MSSRESLSHRRFRRNADQAMLGGVCAGLADYFGLNLRMTRIVVAIAFLAMPITILAYIGILFLIPAESSRGRTTRIDAEFNRVLRSSPKQTMSDVRGRFRSLDRRLARLEKYVTSSRFQLDREFKNLEI